MGSCIKSKKRAESDESEIDQSEEMKARRRVQKRKKHEVIDPVSINEAEIIVLDEDDDQKQENFPEFFTTSSNNGIWSYSLDTADSEFPESTNQEIESAYLSGKSQIEVKIEDSNYNIKFKESLMFCSENVYPVIRTELVPASYGWQVDDGTIRPFIKELADILEVTGGEIKCKIDGAPYSVSLPKRQMIDLTTKIKSKIILL